MARLGRERVRATAWGLLVSVLLLALIIAGSRSLQHFDAALIGYTFATLFATFGIAYRYANRDHRMVRHRRGHAPRPGTAR